MIELNNMGWIKVILDLFAKGLEWLNNKQLLQAGRAQAEKENSDETIKALEARDRVDPDDDSLLLPPDKR